MTTRSTAEATTVSVEHGNLCPMRNGVPELGCQCRLEMLRRAVVEEIEDLQRSLRIGDDYHGAEKHPPEWHRGFEACAKSSMRELVAALEYDARRATLERGSSDAPRIDPEAQALVDRLVDEGRVAMRRPDAKTTTEAGTPHEPGINSLADRGSVESADSTRRRDKAILHTCQASGDTLDEYLACAGCQDEQARASSPETAKPELRCTGRRCIEDCGAMLEIDPDCEKHGYIPRNRERAPHVCTKVATDAVQPCPSPCPESPNASNTCCRRSPPAPGGRRTCLKPEGHTGEHTDGAWRWTEEESAADDACPARCANGWRPIGDLPCPRCNADGKRPRSPRTSDTTGGAK